MPYIASDLRSTLEFLNPLPANAGELNYAISHLVHRYIEQQKGPSYAVLNEVHGVLHCVNAELYRTVTGPYEDTKRATNGSVSNLDGTPSLFSAPSSDTVNERLTIKIDSSEMVQALTTALREAAKQAATGAPAAENSPAISAPSAAQEPAKQPATSATRRPARVVGESPMGGVANAPSSTPVARDEEAAPRSTSVPKGHIKTKLDTHAAKVWEDAGRGNGEDDYGI